MRIDYEVFGPEGTEPIATGYTIHGFVNAQQGRPTRAPAQFLEAVEEAGDTARPERIGHALDRNFSISSAARSARRISSTTPSKNTLTCTRCGTVYQVKNDIPIMLVDDER